jgi:hypothetical protein
MGDDIKTDLEDTKYDGMDWIWLAQDRDQQWYTVNVALSLLIPYEFGNFLTKQLSAFQEGLWSMELVKYWCYVFY